jgi:mannosyltransferase OCH1-like enzyme
MIPRILHQTWKTKNLPPSLQHYGDTWKRLNKDWDYRFYTDIECRELVCADFPQFLATFDSFLFPVQRADFFRVLAVYRFGGFYADMDMECLRPFEPFAEFQGALFSVEAHLTRHRQRELGYRYPFQLANCVFAAEAGHPFLLKLIECIAATMPAQSLEVVEDNTGPRLLTRLFYKHVPEDVMVLKQIYWMPPRTYPKIFPFHKNMFARHHFLGSWKEERKHRSIRRAMVERDLLPTPFPRDMFQRFM